MWQLVGFYLGWLGNPGRGRALGVGGQILFDLNVGKMMLMSAPQNFYGLGGFGLEIVDYVTE